MIAYRKNGISIMSYEFVHVTSENPRQDAAATTRVRVHAMRDYRQRQDEQRRRSKSRTPLSRTQSRQRHSPLQPSPSSSEHDDVDPALQINGAMLIDMQQIIEMYRAWIMSYNPHQLLRIVKVATAPWRYPTSPIMIHAQCLEAVGQMEVIENQSLPFTEMQRTRVKFTLLRLANERVADPGIAHHDDTLAALASLVIHEASLPIPKTSCSYHNEADIRSSDPLRVRGSQHTSAWNPRSTLESYRTRRAYIKQCCNLPRNVN